MNGEKLLRGGIARLVLKYVKDIFWLIWKKLKKKVIIFFGGSWVAKKAY